ncbi:MAG: hypothetical protein WBK77_01195 [Alphaproteobacteria bacterium]
MMQHVNYVKFLVLAVVIACGYVLPVQADNLNNAPWGFANQNRASIAALIKQVEDNGSSSGSNASGLVGSNITNLVCGDGQGSSKAQGNSACVILNNSTGDITTGQDTTGDQTAENTSTETTTVNETINTTEAVAPLSEALDELED